MPTFLLKERVVRSDGSGPVIELGPDAGKLLVLTLGITRIVEHQSLEVSVWGSADGEDWGRHPIARYPQKLYCGLYSTLLNLSARPDVSYVRVQWQMHRLSKSGDSAPLFGFYAYVEESGARIVAAVA